MAVESGETSPTPAVPRRRFLQYSGGAAGAVSLAHVFAAFSRRTSAGEPNIAGKTVAGYGPLAPVNDETTGLPFLQLPAGFRYRSFGWTNEVMDDGIKTPPMHDGMGVIAGNEGVLTLCRNHEVNTDKGSFGSPQQSFDSRAGGGCTLLTFNTKTGEWLGSRVGIAGTVRNCAGGVTPWGTWLTCEETTLAPGDNEKLKVYKYEREHGWIFEVPAKGAKNPQPLKDMGRFVHEAIAVDPDTGIVYETEDRGTSGFYRFLPDQKGNLAAGGKLQMLRVPGHTDLRKNVDPHKNYPCEWVDIADPQRAHSSRENKDSLGVFMQGKQQNATTFARLEGCWYGDGKIHFDATSGGNKKCGQIWEYDPAENILRLIYESPNPEILDMPDNLTVTPNGGLVLCEDSDHRPQRMHGLTKDGQLVDLAVNNVILKKKFNGFRGDYRKQEWCGACFSPDGQWLFANIQTPGFTVAITGPWKDGGL